jgi:uncharacterized membrane protein YeaQ/YmgE (transglycosylase-associated protein family)
MFLECNATAPDGSDKKTGVSEQPASFKQPLTSPPATCAGVMSALYQKWTRILRIEGAGRWGPFSATNALKRRGNHRHLCLIFVMLPGKHFRPSQGQGIMSFSGESFFIIFIILFAGLIIGWLSDMIVQRTRFGLSGIIAMVIVGAVIGGGLTFLRDAIQMAINFPLTKAPKEIDVSILPPFERVVLPLAPLRPLFKPVVYRTREEICDTLIEAARNNDLPAHFFIRLLYQESSFRPYAISSAGALGIAQFMPETAGDRGLDNPFDPIQAIPASARLLRDMAQKFGNLGLAAAAYNAGPRRIQEWLGKKGPLPQETQAYVKTITSWPAETWTFGAQTGSPAIKVQREAPCQETVGLMAWDGPDVIPMPPPNPRVQEALERARLAKQAAARSKASQGNSQTAKRDQDAGIDATDAKTDAKNDLKPNPKTDGAVDANADAKIDATVK